jgi:predicted N-acyltransferase
VHQGGLDLLPEFYSVFCENMRDLGTPVYPRRFFEALLSKFPEQCVIVVVRCAGKAAAAAFLVVSGTLAEIPWACCRSRAKPLGFNMKLYWEVLEAAIALGCTRFDFGRSTRGSGTYRFKQQWGAQPVQLYWYRWEKRPGAPKADLQRTDGRGLLHYASVLWSRMPLPLSNALGPLVSPSLPW